VADRTENMEIGVAARTTPALAQAAGVTAAATESKGPVPTKILYTFFFRSRPVYIYLTAVEIKKKKFTELNIIN
jgi:hypothetical protein